MRARTSSRARAPFDLAGMNPHDAWRLSMRSVSSGLVTVALVMLSATSAVAQAPTQAGTPSAPLTQEQKRDLRKDRRDLRQDRRDVRHDRRDIVQDRRDVRHDERDIA